MHSLILTLISIGLLAALATASVTYVPWWQRDASNTEAIVDSGMRKLERAFQLHAKAHADTPAPALGGADGGLAANFQAYLGFVPAAPAGFAWAYGVRPNDGTAYSNMSYFCLYPAESGAGQMGKVRGIYRFAAYAGQGQAVYSNTTCGAISNTAMASEFPQSVRLTYYVPYVAGMSE